MGWYNRSFYIGLETIIIFVPCKLVNIFIPEHLYTRVCEDGLTFGASLKVNTRGTAGFGTTWTNKRFSYWPTKAFGPSLTHIILPTKRQLEQLGYVSVSSHRALIQTVSTHGRATQHKHQSIYPFCIQFSAMIMSRVCAADGEINLALIEICQFLQAVMDVIYHSGQICARTFLLLTALSWQECPKMSPVVCRLTF